MCVHVNIIYFWKDNLFYTFSATVSFQMNAHDDILLWFFNFILFQFYDFWFLFLSVGICIFFFVSADMLKEVKYLAVYHVVYFFFLVLISISHAYKNILYDTLVCYYTIDLLFFFL